MVTVHTIEPSFPPDVKLKSTLGFQAGIQLKTKIEAPLTPGLTCELSARCLLKRSYGSLFIVPAGMTQAQCVNGYKPW